MIQSSCHAASSGRSADLKLCPLTFVGQLGALLQQAARPGDDGQRDSAPELLQKPHQRRVGHPPRAFPIHLQQDVSTPTQNNNNTEVGSKWTTRLNVVTINDRSQITNPWRPRRKENHQQKKGLNTLSCRHYMPASPQQ